MIEQRGTKSVIKQCLCKNYVRNFEILDHIYLHALTF